MALTREQSQIWQAMNVGVQWVLRDGVEFKKLYITHDDLLQGGTLEFIIASKPNKARGRKPADKPYSLSAKAK